MQLNLAAAHLKLQHWKEAAAQASKVLEGDAFHVKALYRRAQVCVGGCWPYRRRRRGERRDVALGQ